VSIVSEQIQQAADLSNALEQLRALTANIRFKHRNSGRGQCKITRYLNLTPEQVEQRIEQARRAPIVNPYANRFFRRPTPTRVMDEIIEQQFRTGTFSVKNNRQTQRFIQPAVERALKHLKPTATPHEFYEQCVSELGERLDIADIRTALRSIIREQ
jgi:hypothetical protein